jgi:hypothetical protein
MVVLRGVAFCSHCQAPMYRREYAASWAYICSNVRTATGLCDARAIPAAAVEKAVIEHLADFRMDVAAWLRERAEDGRAERGKQERDVARLRAERARVVGTATPS